MVQDYQQQKIIDNRKIKDKQLIEQEYDRIVGYLEDTQMEDPPSKLKLQNGLGLKEYVIVINHLLGIIGIDPIRLDYEKVEFTKKVGEGLINIQEILGYPEKNRLKQTDMPSISSSNSAKALLFLTWIVELTEFSTVMTNDIGNLQSDITQEQFIANVCNADDPESLLQGKEYNIALHSLYKDFLASNGSEGSKQREIIFNLMSQDIDEKTKSLVSKQNQQNIDLKRQKSKYQTEYQTNKIKFDQQVQNYIQFLDDPQLQTILQSESQSLINQQQNEAQQLLQLYNDYKQKFIDIENQLKDQLVQNENHVIPDYRDQIKQNIEKMDQLNNQQQQVDQNIKEIQQQQQAQSATYQDYVRAEYANKNLNDENSNLESQINELNKKIEQICEYQRQNEEDINSIIDRLNELQIAVTSNIDDAQLVRQQSDIRKQSCEIETQLKTLQIKLNELLSQQADLEHTHDQLSKVLDEQIKAIETAQKQIQQKNEEDKQQAQYYQQQAEKGQEEFNSLKQNILSIQNQIQEKTQSNTILQSEVQQQQKRLEGEQKKLIDVVTQIYQIIADARKECRSNLEMLRYKLANAKEQLQKWKQINPI